MGGCHKKKQTDARPRCFQPAAAAAERAEPQPQQSPVPPLTQPILIQPHYYPTKLGELLDAALAASTSLAAATPLAAGKHLPDDKRLAAGNLADDKRLAAGTRLAEVIREHS